MYTNIKNIIFDFGGVLLDIDYQRTYESLTKLLNINFKSGQLPEEHKTVFHDFETGHINKENFILHLQSMSSKAIPEADEIIMAWNAMLIGWNPDKFDFLLSLRTKYKVFLLSNTNELHLNWVYNDLRINHQMLDFDHTYFDKTYYSHLVGLRKPNKEMYEYVTADANLHPHETLFIDDMRENILGCQTIGWQAHHNNPNEDLIYIFRKVLYLI